MKFTAFRKERVLQLIDENKMSEIDIFVKWGITGPELEEWRRNKEKSGTAGLRINYCDKGRRHKKHKRFRDLE